MQFHLFSVIVLVTGLLCAWTWFWWFPQVEDEANTTRSTKRKVNGTAKDTATLFNGLISVIIPASNESADISQLLQSLTRAEADIHEILVVADGSAADQASVAGHYGATLLTVAPELADAAGRKSVACAYGASHASGDYLLFVDADVTFQPGGLRKLTHAYGNGEHGLSIQPYQEVASWADQCSGFFNVLAVSAVQASAIAPIRRHSRGSFASCLFIAQSTYDHVAGHVGVRSTLFDHFARCRPNERSGMPILRMGGHDVVHFRSHSNGWRQLFDGWRKSSDMGASSRSVSAFAAIAVWLTGALTAASGLCDTLYVGTAHGWSVGDFLRLVAWLCAYGGFALHADWSMRQVGSFRHITAILYPLPLLVFLVRLCISVAETLVRKQNVWNGHGAATRKKDVDGG